MRPKLNFVSLIVCVIIAVAAIITIVASIQLLNLNLEKFSKKKG